MYIKSKGFNGITVECIKDIDDDFYKVSNSINSNFYLQKRNDVYIRTDTDVLFHSIIHKQIQFDFMDCHPLVVIKVITDLKDVVDFIDKSYEYELDGTEILKNKYPIGSVLKFRKKKVEDISWADIKVTVIAYQYNRKNKKIVYITVTDSGQKLFCDEEELLIDRDTNLGSILDN
jgi:hypothetical protein